LDWQNSGIRNKVLESIESYCRKRKAIFIKIDPEVDLGTGVPASATAQENSLGQELTNALTSRGWRFSNEQVQFKNTVLIDLTGSEEDWMSRMKQKTRYNIRLAQRSDVNVRQGRLDDLPNLYHMYAQTAARDGFILREENYYSRLWKNFIDAEFAVPLIAEVEGEAVAALILFVFGDTAWYFYGMSTTNQREKMPNYLLQWEAMRIAKTLGCTIYDLWGAPDTFEGADSMSGVFRFKEGLGGVLHRTIGAWDFSNRPFTYFVYQVILPRILEVTRRIRRGAIKKEIQ
jgi:lipid II:glycine glycyltransferase (peptidoglycan interpeptide bridge formation enzyme)